MSLHQKLEPSTIHETGATEEIMWGLKFPNGLIPTKSRSWGPIFVPQVGRALMNRSK